MCAHQLFEVWAAQTPQAIAVADEHNALTYRDLNVRANQLAHVLQGQGIGPDVLVAICFERSIECIVALLAVLKAGGAYVPLDPSAPAARLTAMLADAQARVVVTLERWSTRLSDSGVAVVCLDRDRAVIADAARHNPPGVATPAHLAYVIYTSGSTGVPKGVQITHGSLLNLICSYQRTFALTPSDRTALLSTPAFDASILETWPYLAAGACVYAPKEDIRTSPERLRDWIEAMAITVAFMTTPLAVPLLSLEWSERTALRLLITGGDVLHQYPPASLPFTLINAYGPTEITVVASAGPVAPQAADQGAPDIGRSFADAELYVLDAQLQPAPVGEPGELYIGGVGLARGYLNRPELTAERFVPNPFGAGGWGLGAGEQNQEPGTENHEPGTDDAELKTQHAKPRAYSSRLYRTGDLVRQRPDGRLDFLGRLDGQVKIRGLRIELDEITVVLSRHPAVQIATVQAVRTSLGESHLVAYIVAQASGQAPRPAELQAYLRERLPEYMVPIAYVWLGALPLTPNGKVDRTALPAVDLSQRERAVVAPRTPTEAAVAAIWGEVLGIAEISVDDNFLELGGYSLLATRIVARAAGLFHVELSLHQLLEAQTVASFAAVIDQTKQRAEPHTPAIPRLDRRRHRATPA